MLKWGWLILNLIVAIELLVHQSEQPTVLGVYSRGYAAFLAASLLVQVFFCVFLLWGWVVSKWVAAFGNTLFLLVLAMMISVLLIVSPQKMGLTMISYLLILSNAAMMLIFGVARLVCQGAPTSHAQALANWRRRTAERRGLGVSPDIS